MSSDETKMAESSNWIHNKYIVSDRFKLESKLEQLCVLCHMTIVFDPKFSEFGVQLFGKPTDALNDSYSMRMKTWRNTERQQNDDEFTIYYQYCYIFDNSYGIFN